jgi:hypothetical protein
MKTLTLHIGLPKTGTTYIQGWLQSNRAALAAAGTWVPSRQIFAHRLAAEFINDAKRAARSDVVNIRGAPFEAARNDLLRGLEDQRFQRAILSSEYFFEADPRQVASLGGLAPDTQVRIIIYLRRQDRIIESGYNQEVKAMGATSQIAAGAYQPKLDWLRLFESWAAVFGETNVALLNFDLASRSGDVLGEFCRAAGLMPPAAGDAPAPSDQWRNESLPANLLEFKRLANMVASTDLEDFLHQAVKAGIGGPSFRLKPEAAKAHLAFYDDGNRELARRLGRPAGDPLFPEDDLNGHSAGGHSAGSEPAGVDLTGRLPLKTVAQLLALHIQHSTEQAAAASARISALEQEVAAIRQRPNENSSSTDRSYAVQTGAQIDPEKSPLPRFAGEEGAQPAHSFKTGAGKVRE